MDSAIDGATDQRTFASDASERRRYKCATCYAAVVLRGGSYKMRRHFAHAKGEADPDCQEYFPSYVPYTGRRWVIPATAGSGTNWEPGSLYFDLTLAGPRLAVSIPAAAESGEWAGSVEFQAHQVTRRMTAQHLERGQLISFDLFDGQWSVAVDGEVSGDYLSRLDLGDNSLEVGLNLFDATQSPGRRLGPSDPLRLGDAVWVLTRDPSFGSASAAQLTACELRCTAGGWHVFYVGLPNAVTREDAQLIAVWLERQIRPQQARVWIEHPLPAAYTTEGIAVFPLPEGALEVRSDQPVDLLIRRFGAQAVNASASYSPALNWNHAEPGRWLVGVNGVDILMFDLALKPPEAIAAIRATIGAECYDLFAAQNVVDGAPREGVQEKVTVSWTSPSLARLITVDDRPVGESNQCITIANPAGRVISAGNLGALRWPSPRENVESQRQRPLTHLYPRARWLISVALPIGTTNGVSIRVPEDLEVDRILRGLSDRRWDETLEPQLRSFVTAMEALP